MSLCQINERLVDLLPFQLFKLAMNETVHNQPSIYGNGA
jgi:hypothetical protein